MNIPPPPYCHSMNMAARYGHYRCIKYLHERDKVAITIRVCYEILEGSRLRLADSDGDYAKTWEYVRNHLFTQYNIEDIFSSEDNPCPCFARLRQSAVLSMVLRHMTPVMFDSAMLHFDR